MGSSVVVALQPEHAGAYRALMLEAYRLHPDAFTSTVEERAVLPESWWVERIGRATGSDSRAFGIFEGDELAGTVALNFETKPKTRHKAILIGMYVRDRYRGRGFGRALVEVALAAARARAGTQLVQLTVSDNNPSARRLYESAGFVLFGVEPMAIRAESGFVAKCHMWCALGADDAGGQAPGPDSTGERRR